MNQQVLKNKKRKMKFGKKNGVAKAFMDSNLSDLYDKRNIVSLTIVPCNEEKDAYDLLYVYEQ
ncbi:MAG: hypothetical protein MJZ22_02540 [Candidatus Saccharibacteria bacterium]|nr:hypothetical protein [Candidatus Saccharibacteria bacterium]